MAGTLPGFDPDVFRAGIRQAMNVGLAPAVSDQPVFIFAEVPGVPVVPADGENVPFDLTHAVAGTTPPPVSGVPCAVEYAEGSPVLTALGVVIPAKAKITFLDQDYALVRGYREVRIGGVAYTYSHTETPQGLGPVGVFVDHVVAGTDL